MRALSFGVVAAERNLNFLTTNYHYLTWVLPIVVVAPKYFAGNVEMGVISQASSAFGHILSDLSLVVNSFTDLSKFSAGIERLFTFLNTIRELGGNRASLLSAPTPAKDAAKGDGAGEAATEVPEPGAIRVRETDPFLTAPPS